MTSGGFFGVFVGSMYVNGTLVYSESYPAYLASALGLSCMVRSVASILIGPVIGTYVVVLITEKFKCELNSQCHC